MLVSDERENRSLQKKKASQNREENQQTQSTYYDGGSRYQTWATLVEGS